MKRYLPFMLMLPLGMYAYACSSNSSDGGGTTTPPGSSGNPDPGSSGNPSPPGSSGNPSPAGGEDLTKNPIDGIGEVKAILQTDAYTDGPIWHEGQKVLFFTTPLGGVGALYRMRADGSAKKVRDGAPEGLIPIGDTVDKAGNLITVEAQRIVRSNATADGGALEQIANGYNNGTVFTKFDTLNDAVVRTVDGSMFVTDPGYFLGAPGPTSNRIYRVTADGAVTVADAFEDVPRPNGIAFNPDQTELYVGFTQPNQGTLPFIRKYHLNDDGTLGEAAKWVDVDPADSAPDGIEVDKGGNVYVATAQGIVVFKSDATKIGVIAVPEIPTGMAFGGDDMKTMFITTQQTKIWTVKVNVPGIAQ